MAEDIITSRDTATDHEYDGSEIQVLKGLEAVRKRPGMYIGSTGERGLHHLVYEIVDNSIDEALAGHCDHIEVKIKKGDVIEVTDNGRGIPVGVQPDTGLPAVTVVFTILHAGGKFGGENSGYKVSGGLHGVGASVVNACSEWLTVQVRRDGKEYEQTFRRGDPDGPLREVGPAPEGSTGTRVTFKPDPEMFRETTVFDFDTLEKRLREESFLNAGLKITLTDERELYTPILEDGQEGAPCYRQEVMCYEGGIRSFVTYLNEKRNLEVLHPSVIYLAARTDKAEAEIAMQYNTSYNELVLSFANNVNTPDGGTHEEGFRSSLTRVFNDYGRSHGLLKDKDENLSGSDVREGLICVISVKLQEAEFEGQTKAKLGNTEIRTMVSNMVYTRLTEFFEENPAVAKAIFEKATPAARAPAPATKCRAGGGRPAGDPLRPAGDRPGAPRPPPHRPPRGGGGASGDLRRRDRPGDLDQPGPGGPDPAPRPPADGGLRADELRRPAGPAAPRRHPPVGWRGADELPQPGHPPPDAGGGAGGRPGLVRRRAALGAGRHHPGDGRHRAPADLSGVSGGL